MTRAAVFISFIAFALGASAARAQEPGQVGITMGYPPSIGVIWHLSNAIAIRPEIAIAKTTSNTTAVYTTSGPGGPISTETSLITSDQWSVGFGASALFYVTRTDALRTYISPRFIYTRGSSVTSVGVLSSGPTDITTNAYTVSGSFGAQYALATRFGVFGEVGLAYSDTKSDSSTTATANSTQHSFGTRGAVGVILYFPH